VCDTGTARDQSREAADRSVPDATVLVIAGVDGTKDVTAKRAFEFVDGCRVEFDGGSDGGHGHGPGIRMILTCAIRRGGPPFVRRASALFCVSLPRSSGAGSSGQRRCRV